MSASDFDPSLMKLVPPSSTKGYDLWARENAQAIAAQQANIYRMQLSAAEMTEKQLQAAKLQQAAQQQQQQYAYGWHDPLTIQQAYNATKEPDLNKLLWNIKPITWRPKLAHVFIFGAIAMIVFGILIKVAI